MSTAWNEKCRVCGAPTGHIFTEPLLGRPVRYFDCRACGYVQTQQPDWLEQAYSHAINDVDTGILLRNRVNVGRVVMTLAAFGRLRGRVVDHAGGYGILVRLLRDAGVDARWRDKYCANLLARGFEDDGEPCDLLSAFEVFEHLVDPLNELRAMLERAPVVLVSTDLVRGDAPPARDWWYLGPEHGQHIGFFRARTLHHMATALGCHDASDGRSLHLFSRTPLPTRWRLLMRASRAWPLAAWLRLQSRTQVDFAYMRSGRIEAPSR